MLHDVLEATQADAEDVRARFGDRVTGIVTAVTEDPEIADFGARKAALRAQVARGGADVLAVYAADKLAKTRELRSLVNRGGTTLDDEALRPRLEHYQRSLAMIQRAEPDHPFGFQLAFELWALHALPPSPPAHRRF